MNKQIEELAHLVCERDAEDLCTLDRKRCDMKCTSGDIAKHLYSHGYRKCTDVAREIFEEIVKFIFSEIPDELMPIYKAEKDFRDGVISGKREAFFKVLTHLDNHLRKKYESEGADDEQIH